MLNFQEIKSLWGLRLMPWCFRSIVAYHIIIAVTLAVEICLDGDGLMFIEKGPIMESPDLSCSLLPSFSGTPTLLRRLSLFGVIPTLARILVPGAIRSVRVHGAMGLTGLLGKVSLIYQLNSS